MVARSFVSITPTARLALLLIPTTIAAACGRPDSSVKEAIEAQLAKDPVTARSSISVSVSRGVAFLSGETPTVDAQTRAIEIARTVAGVSDVVNEMELDANAPLLAAVKKALAGDPLLASIPIDVEAQDGLVRLMSDATNREQRERAVAVARAVDGVTDVEDRMK